MAALIHRVCGVCGQADSRAWFRPPRSPGPLVQCRRCGFVYVDPIERPDALIQAVPLSDRSPRLLTSRDLRDIEGSWEAPFIAAYVCELPAKQRNAQAALAGLEALRPARGRLLDVGCGCGVLLSVARERGWTPAGVEPSVMPAIYARGRFDLDVRTDILRPGLFAPGSFDVVTAFQVFEHLLDPAEVLAEIWTVLRPGGLVAIEVPNIATPAVAVLRGRHRHFVEDHVSFFSARTLRQLLARLGFRPRRVIYPARVLSLQHLAGWWLRQYTGPAAGERVGRWLRRLNLEMKTVRVNLGDIVMVVAEKA